MSSKPSTVKPSSTSKLSTNTRSSSFKVSRGGGDYLGKFLMVILIASLIYYSLKGSEITGVCLDKQLDAENDTKADSISSVKKVNGAIAGFASGMAVMQIIPSTLLGTPAKFLICVFSIWVSYLITGVDEKIDELDARADEDECEVKEDALRGPITTAWIIRGFGAGIIGSVIFLSVMRNAKPATQIRSTLVIGAVAGIVMSVYKRKLESNCPMEGEDLTNEQKTEINDVSSNATLVLWISIVIGVLLLGSFKFLPP